MSDESTAISVDQASPQELQSVPEISPTQADRAVESRTHESTDNPRRIGGIGASMLDKVRSALIAEPSDPRPSNGQKAVEIPPAAEEIIPPAEAESSPVGYEPAAQAAAPDFPEPQNITDQNALSGEAEGVETPAGAGADIPAWKEEDLVEEETPADEQFPIESGPAPEDAASAGALPAFTTSAPETGFKRGQVVGLTLGMAFITFVLAVLASLGVLYTVNGGLSYTSPADLSAVRRQADGLSAQLTLLEQDLGSVRSRLENLEALSGRVRVLESGLQQAQAEVSTAVERIDRVNEEISALNTQLEALRASSSRFQSFLEGLQKLLENLVSP